MSPGPIESFEEAQAVRARIENDYTYHPPHGNQAARYGAIRAAGRDMAIALLDRCPPGRERSVALTKIDEAVFWANAAIARNEQAPAAPDARPSAPGTSKP